MDLEPPGSFEPDPPSIRAEAKAKNERELFAEKRKKLGRGNQSTRNAFSFSTVSCQYCQSAEKMMLKTILTSKRDCIDSSEVAIDDIADTTFGISAFEDFFDIVDKKLFIETVTLKM